MSQVQIPNSDHYIWRARINHLCKSGLDPIDCKSSSFSGYFEEYWPIMTGRLWRSTDGSEQGWWRDLGPGRVDQLGHRLCQGGPLRGLHQDTAWEANTILILDVTILYFVLLQTIWTGYQLQYQAMRITLASKEITFIVIDLIAQYRFLFHSLKMQIQDVWVEFKI